MMIKQSRLYLWIAFIVFLTACNAKEISPPTSIPTESSPTSIANAEATQRVDFIRQFMRAQKRNDPQLDELVRANLPIVPEAIESYLDLSEGNSYLNSESGWDDELYNAYEYLEAAEKLAIIYANQTGDTAPKEKAAIYKVRLQGRRLVSEGYDLAESDPDAALTKMFEAVEMFRSSNAPADEAKALYNIATLYRNLQEYEQSIKYFEQATTLFEQEKDYSMKAMALYNIASAYIGLKEIDKTISAYEQAAVLFEQEKEYTSATDCLVQLTLAYAYQGQTDQAKETAKRAVQTAEASGDAELVAKVKEYLSSFLTN